MGKLKVSKAKKNKNSKGTSGIPNWLLSTLVIITVVAVLLTCVGTVLASSGLPMKMITPMSYDGEYKLDGNVMKYFFSTQYNNVVNQQYSTYSQYASFLGDITFEDYMKQYVGFSPSVSLDSQQYGDGTDENIKTWRDYFEEQTTKSVKQLLIYRAEAIKLGLKLDEEDQKKIDEDIEQLLTSLRSYYPGYSDSKCLAINFGAGVGVKDVRKAMELEAIATKAAEHISTTIEDAIDDKRIEDAYNKDKNKFDLVDHLSYSFEVDYTDIIEEVAGEGKTAEKLTDEEKTKVNNKYKEEIKKAHDKAVELAGVKTPEEFEKWVIKYATNEFYDKEFNSAMSKLTDSEKPAAEILTAIKAEMISAVIKDVEAGKLDDKVFEEKKEGETTTYVVYGKTVSKTFAEAAKTLKSNLYNAVVTEKDYCNNEKTNYISKEDNNNVEDKFSIWAFAADRKVNDIKNIETGDGADGAEIDTSKSLDRFTAEVSIIKKTAYKDETISRDVAYMLFTKEDMAKKAVEALEATKDLTKDKFLKVADDENNKADAHSDLEDYFIGNMQSDDFDNWLLAAKKDEYTKTPITMSDGSFMVAYYVGEGELKAWENTVKGAIYEEDYKAYEDRMNEDYGTKVIINKKVLNFVDFKDEF